MIVCGERLTARAARRARGARAAERRRRASGSRGRDGAGLLEVPAAANGRGLREAGVLPERRPGPRATPQRAGPRRRGIAAGRAAGELTALYLLHADPLRDQPDRAAVGARRSSRRTHGRSRTRASSPRALARARDVVFPAESYAEKEGTVTHPDGRVQRLRRPIGRPGDVARRVAGPRRAVAARSGTDLGVLTGAMAHAQLFEAVPFYAGLTLEEIGGRGVRWPEREQAAAHPAGEPAPFDARPTRPPPRPPTARLRLGTLPLDLGGARGRRLAGAEVPRARASASSSRPPTRSALGIAQGDRVERRRRTARSVSGDRRTCAPPRPPGIASSCETAIGADSASALDGPARRGAQAR